MNTHSHDDHQPRLPISVDHTADAHKAIDASCARSTSGDAKSAPASVAASSSDVLDPVCGMQVDPVTAKHRAEHDGSHLLFLFGPMS